MFIGFKICGQNEMVDNAIPDVYGKIEIKKEVSGNNDFIIKYNINTNQGKKAKILSETHLRTGTELSSEQFQMISTGTNIETYKYFPKDAVWAIKYNEYWGFVPATAIMILQEKTTEADQLLYDEAPKMLSAIKINYPVGAKNAGTSGKVIVKALISKTGSVIETEIAESIPGLDDAAKDAVKKVKFKPGKFDGKPVEVWIRIPVNFEIE
jgi:TonB family protein